MTALVRRIGSVVDAVDMFSGFGGTSGGIQAAGADVRVAANHNAHAIDVHAANFPDTEHHVADLVDVEAPTYIDPEDLPAARLLVASPSCRHHSPANSKKLYRSKRNPTLLDLLAEDEGDDLYAASERSRVTMVCPLRYAAKHLPELVIIENVVEACKWGPDRDGSTFRWWLGEWDKLGYDHENLFLNSMAMGVPQSRDRYYGVFWRKGNPAPDLEHRLPVDCDRCGESEAAQKWKPTKKTWPLPRWGKLGPQYTYACVRCGADVDPIVPGAWTAIDWSDLGPTIGERVRPLAPKTLDRIRRGLEKFADAPAIIIPAAGNTYERAGQTRARAITEPLFAQTGTLQHGIATRPFLVEMRGGGSVAAGQHSVLDPMHTVTAGGLHHGFVSTMVGTHEHALNQNRRLHEPLTALTTRGHHGLVTSMYTKVNGGPTDTAWHPVTEQLGTITGRDTTALLSALTLPLTHHHGDRARHVGDPLATLTASRERYLAAAPAPEIDLDAVHFRMLKPDPELRRAMAFPDDYELFGTQTQITAGLGNAVTPPVAAWIAQRALATLDAAGDGDGIAA